MQEKEFKQILESLPLEKKKEFAFMCAQRVAPAWASQKVRNFLETQKLERLDDLIVIYQEISEADASIYYFQQAGVAMLLLQYMIDLCFFDKEETWDIVGCVAEQTVRCLIPTVWDDEPLNITKEELAISHSEWKRMLQEVYNNAEQVVYDNLLSNIVWR